MRTPLRAPTLPESFFSFASPGRTGTLPAGAAATATASTSRSAPCCTSRTPAAPVTCRGDPRRAVPAAVPRALHHAVHADPARPVPVVPLRDLRDAEHLHAQDAADLPLGRAAPRAAGRRSAIPGAVGTATCPADRRSACHKLTAATAPARSPSASLPTSPSRGRCTTPPASEICDEYTDYRVLPAAGGRRLHAAGGRTGTSLRRADHLPGGGRPRSPQRRVRRHDRHVLGPAGTPGAPDLGRADQLPAVQRQRPATGSSPTRPRPCTTRLCEWLVDSAGATALHRVRTGEDGCVLPATGTYRVISYLRGLGRRRPRTYVQAAGPAAVDAGRMPDRSRRARTARRRRCPAASAAGSWTSRRRAPTW